MAVLLVDDSQTMRRIQKNVLVEIGIEDVREASDGDEALALLRADPAAFQLVLLDVNMPNKNGLQTVQEIKKDAALKHLPVIMVSSESERSIVLQAIQAGAGDYCVKPFKKETILEKIARFLPRK